MISAVVTLIVCIINNNSQNNKTRALMEYRLNELTKHVEKHNEVIERTFRLEREVYVQQEKLSVANHRIEDLEKKLA